MKFYFECKTPKDGLCISIKADSKDEAIRKLIKTTSVNISDIVSINQTPVKPNGEYITNDDFERKSYPYEKIENGKIIKIFT